MTEHVSIMYNIRVITDRITDLIVANHYEVEILARIFDSSDLVKEYSVSTIPNNAKIPNGTGFGGFKKWVVR